MNSRHISIAKDFSPFPAGRYVDDGPYPAERFRDELLLPALRDNDTVVVDLDGTAGFGSSFLEEAFGGLVRKGLSADDLTRRLRIKSERRSYEVRIWRYIADAVRWHPSADDDDSAEDRVPQVDSKDQVEDERTRQMISRG